MVATRIAGFGSDGPSANHACGWTGERIGDVVVVQLRYNLFMKTATIPSVRVEPDFRAKVEAVLAEGETLSEFVEASIRASVERRQAQAEFIARGLRSRDKALRTGEYVDADVVLKTLERKLQAARTRMTNRNK